MAKYRPSSLENKKPRDSWKKRFEKLSTRNKVAILVALIPSLITATVGLITLFVTPFLDKAVDKPVEISSENPISTELPAAAIVSLSSSRYGFENGTSGWEKTAWPYTREAIEDITTVQVPDHDAIMSSVLEITVNFTGQKNKRQEEFREAGEVQVDLITNPPTGYATSLVDLNGKDVIAWVWSSIGSSGDPTHKNGFQLFVKDDKDNSCYGKWFNIDKEDEGKWFRVYWRKSDAVLCDADFNSSQPKILGLKIALGDNTNIVYDTSLKIYLDDVNWDTP